LIGIKGYYWKEGTHYYKSKPEHFDHRGEGGIIVVGEMISINQGWVEGALESVDKAFS
jgi:monoamine oxidase